MLLTIPIPNTNTTQKPNTNTSNNTIVHLCYKVTAHGGATLHLPQKLVPQTISLRKNARCITITDPVSKVDVDKNDLVKPKIAPGKRAVCKNCGTASHDFNKCIRCKKPLAKDCKVVESKTGGKGWKAGTTTVEI